MEKSAIIITSRDYFTCSVPHHIVLEDELLKLMINHFDVQADALFSKIENTDLDSKKRNEAITQFCLRKRFTASNARVRNGIKQWNYAGIYKIDVSEAYVIYLAPCLPKDDNIENFIPRHNYVAGIIQMCVRDMGPDVSSDNIYILTHDNDIIPSTDQRAVKLSDIQHESLLSSLVETSIKLDNMFLFVHSGEQCAIYKSFVMLLSNEDKISPEVFDWAVGFFNKAHKTATLVDELYSYSSKVGDFYTNMLSDD